MKEELNERQDAIREERERQKQLVEDAKEAIARHKAKQKKCPKPSTSMSEVKDNQQVTELKKLLQMRREQRNEVYNNVVKDHSQ